MQDEIEAHARPGSLSVFIHYGGDRTTDPRILTRHHVVLTTYGVLTSAYKPVRKSFTVSLLLYLRIQCTMFLSNLEATSIPRN